MDIYNQLVNKYKVKAVTAVIVRDEGIYKYTKADEINSETKDDQINVNNGENLVPKPPASTGRSITEKISVANNIDNSGSVLDDDPTVKNSINKTPIKAAVVEKEPISLLWLSLVFSLLVNVLIILLTQMIYISQVN